MFHDDLNPIILFCTVLFFDRGDPYTIKILHLVCMRCLANPDSSVKSQQPSLPSPWRNPAFYTLTLSIPRRFPAFYTLTMSIPRRFPAFYTLTMAIPRRSPENYTLTMAIPRRSRSSSISSSWSRVSRVFLPPRLSKFYVTHQKSYPRGKSPRALRRHYKSCSTAAAKVRSLKEQRFVFSKNNCGRIHPDP